MRYIAPSRLAASASVSSDFENVNRTNPRPRLPVVVEARCRHRRHPHTLDQVQGEGRVVSLEAEVAEVGHHVVRPLRPVALEPRPRAARSAAGRASPRTSPAAPGSTALPDSSATAPACCNGAGAPTVRKSCTLRTVSLRCAAATTYPSRHPVTLKRLREPADRHGPVVEPRERRHRQVLLLVDEDVLVDLVGEAEAVELPAERRDSATAPPGRTPCRSGLLGEFTMIAFVRGPNAARSSSGSNTKSSPRSVTYLSVAPAHGRVGHVVLVERLEDDDFVHRVHEGEHRRHDRLGRPAGDRHLALRVDVQPVVAPDLRCDGGPQPRGPPT